jgi:hypothetical protein
MSSFRSSEFRGGSLKVVEIRLASLTPQPPLHAGGEGESNEVRRGEAALGIPFTFFMDSLKCTGQRVKVATTPYIHSA